MKDKFIVAISRDPALISYCQPDLIITTNKVNSYGSIPTICLQDFLPEDSFLSLYDTQLMAIINHENKDFQKLVLKEIKTRAQNKEIFVNPYYNAHTETLRKNDFNIIGPSDDLAYKFSSKTEAYKIALKEKVPVAPGEINVNPEEIKNLFEKNPLGLFVAEDYNHYYPNNFYISKSDDLSKLNPKSKYLVTIWQKNIINSPNTQVIIGPKKILYLGITDQIIKKGVKYYGNNYPCTSSAQNQDRIKEYSLAIAKAMQKEGYRGFAGFDWIEVESGEIFMVEINPRKNRSSAILAGMLDYYRPSSAPSIFELEIMATENQDWEAEEWKVPDNIKWTMEVYKIYKEKKVKENILPSYSEQNIFNTENQYSILNFPKKDQVLTPDCPDIARIITIGSNDTDEAKDKIKKYL